MSGSVGRAGKARTQVGLAVFGVAAVIWLILVSGAAFLAEYQGAEYKCIVDGPSDSRAYPMEAGPVSAGFVMWPLGRECVWPTADGSTVAAHTKDWGPTIAMVGLGATSLWGLAIAVVPVGSVRSRTAILVA